MYRPLKDDAEAAAGWRCHFLSQDQAVPLKFRGEVGAKSEGASSLKKASGDIAKAKKAPCPALFVLSLELLIFYLCVRLTSQRPYRKITGSWVELRRKERKPGEIEREMDSRCPAQIFRPVWSDSSKEFPFIPDFPSNSGFSYFSGGYRTGRRA